MADLPSSPARRLRSLAGFVSLLTAVGFSLLSPAPAGAAPLAAPAGAPAPDRPTALDHDPRCLVLGAAGQTFEICPP